ncbi:hypothetical protein MASR2M78_25470 [Treponema sp.]
MRRIFAAFSATLLAALVLGFLLLPPRSWPTQNRDTLRSEGFMETGATNLVSAIYLGYRAYDTLGETLVLLAALASAAALASTQKQKLSSDFTLATSPIVIRASRHTNIINVTAGKLAPVVLLFGYYVMAYGHKSPGGGFQGGVVLASGIIFIAMGRRMSGGSIRPSTLLKMEALAFIFILLLSISGLLGGVLFLGNPLDNFSFISPVLFIIAFNAAIGLKVSSGIAMLCLLMLEGEAW